MLAMRTCKGQRQGCERRKWGDVGAEPLLDVRAGSPRNGRTGAGFGARRRAALFGSKVGSKAKPQTGW